jgi:hypothetical protein
VAFIVVAVPLGSLRRSKDMGFAGGGAGVGVGVDSTGGGWVARAKGIKYASISSVRSG